MNVYDIDDGHNFSQTHCVVAENIGEAEKIYYEKYPFNTIQKVTLHSEYVSIQNATPKPQQKDG